MKSKPISSEADIQSMRKLIDRLPGGTIIPDFDENIQMKTVRETTRLWIDNDELTAFAYVDDFNNLWFEVDPLAKDQTDLEDEIINWGVECIEKMHGELSEENTLDFSCTADDRHRMDIMSRNRFILQEIRTLHYSQECDHPFSFSPLPKGFSIRSVRGVDEIEDLVTVHQKAFGSDQMTVEERLAIMNAPLYRQDLDLVVCAPDGELAAFCICGFDDEEKKIGYTDPIGTIPKYQKMGLGLAVVTHGLVLLQNEGAEVVELGTSSENTAMQKLAEAAGFKCVSEKLWFSKMVR